MLSSPTHQSSSDLAPEEMENNALSVDDSDSQMDDLYMEALQGETLVPNSPAPDSTVIDDQDELESQTDHNGCIIDKRGHPLACVFVANLNKSKSEEELNISIQRKFEKWGNVLNVKVLKDWMDRPYAFVQYEKTSDAEKVLLKATGTLLNGRRLRCEPAKVNRTLIIVSMGHPLIEKGLRNELSTYGPIEQIQVIQGDSASSARIKFTYRDDAINAFLKLQTLAQSRYWTVEWIANGDAHRAIEKKCGSKNKCVYVGNLDKKIDKSELQDRFGKYGSIENICIIKKPNAHYKTIFGFIKYTTNNSAVMAIIAQDGQEWYGHKLRVSYRDNRRQDFTYDSSYVNGVVPTANSQVGFRCLRPHPPGLGISAAAAATAAAYVYGAYSASQSQSFATTNRSTKEIAISPISSELTTTATTTDHLQYQNQGHQEGRTVMEAMVDPMTDPSNRLTDSTTDDETQPSQQSVRPMYDFKHIEQASHQYYSYDPNYMTYGYYTKGQNQQVFMVTFYPMPGNYYWPPSTRYHQVHYPPIATPTPTPPMYDANSIAYYQMYPYSGTFYFIPIVAKPVPCMDPPISTCDTIRPPPPPIQHTLITT